jgi:hypothetical protein
MRQIMFAIAVSLALTGGVVAVASITTAAPAVAGCTQRC